MFPAVKDSDNRQENKKRNRAIRNQVLQDGDIHRVEFKHKSFSFLLTFFHNFNRQKSHPEGWLFVVETC